MYIKSSGNSLEVEFKGMASGYGSNVYCPDTGNCTIQCSNGGVGCSANRTGVVSGWGNTIVYYTKDTELTVIPKACKPNFAGRDVNVCPEFQRVTNDEGEYNKMVKLVVEKANAEEYDGEEEYDVDMELDGYGEIEEMIFEDEGVNGNVFVSATLLSYLDMNMIYGLIIGGLVFIGMIIGLIMYYCYAKENKYEIIE